MANRARLCGMTPISVVELPLPPQDRQMTIEFPAIDDIPEPTDEEAENPD